MNRKKIEVLIVKNKIKKYSFKKINKKIQLLYVLNESLTSKKILSFVILFVFFSKF